MNPLGRAGLQQLHGLGQRNRPRQRKQQVNVIGDPAHRQGRNSVFASNAAEISMKPLPHTVTNRRPPLRGSEDHMNQTTNVAMGHRFSRPVGTFLRLSPSVPRTGVLGYFQSSLRDSHTVPKNWAAPESSKTEPRPAINPPIPPAASPEGTPENSPARSAGSCQENRKSPEGTAESRPQKCINEMKLP
jgi:hypothetical protein